MSGFSADWLALREPVDHRSRAANVAAACAAHFSDAASIRVTDLGCGSGSNLRALAPLLPRRQKWIMVDHDPALLEAARDALLHWADEAEGEVGGLLLRKAGKTIEARFVAADLAREAGAVLARPAELVTAAALFDLCSREWIAGFIQQLASRRLPLMATLTYDGVEHWSPKHPADPAVLSAFHAHQRRDKGFGASAGPQAGEALADELSRRGYAMTRAQSPWRLGAGDRDLIERLAEGAAAAAAETGEVDGATVRDWLSARRRAQGCEIGHIDIFATI